jgi:Histidine kinase-, DNA gyrase B-, and HSP90-like ATPase
MAATSEQIFVRSHVARDLLQNAGLFKTDKLVVWEYVSNGLQYIDAGTNPVVKVRLDSKNKRISIADNGRGMDWAGLHNFFVMHGENVDRKEGRPGRGRFGTGKSAAFGIADGLRITTVRSKKRSKLELRRADIEKMSSEDPIPVRTTEREVSTSQPNGTLIEIEGIHLKSLDQAGVIHYIQRHLARWPKNVTVFVNNHECEFEEPPVALERKYRAEGEAKRRLGDVALVIKVSKKYLEDDLRGVSIYSNGVWHETTLAGSEGREMSQYIFGEIEVPKLDEDKSPIPPFDVSRSMRLNSNNELVRSLYAFIGQKVEEVRRELINEEKKHKASEEARKLAEQADEIAKVINDDFNAFRQQVAKARAKASGGLDANVTKAGGDAEDDDLIFGTEVPAEIFSECGGVGHGNGHGGGGTTPPNNAPVVTNGLETSEKRGRAAGGTGKERRSSGGFRVEFNHMGTESKRALYTSEKRTIYINLDHPQLIAAKGAGSIEDPLFRRLANEIAFSEYAIALASELDARGNYIDPSDPIFDIRETLNRVARRGAMLYST